MDPPPPPPGDMSRHSGIPSPISVLLSPPAAWQRSLMGLPRPSLAKMLSLLLSCGSGHFERKEEGRGKGRKAFGVVCMYK